MTWGVRCGERKFCIASSGASSGFLVQDWESPTPTKIIKKVSNVIQPPVGGGTVITHLMDGVDKGLGIPLL